MRFGGAQAGIVCTASEVLPGISNYFLGGDPRRWQTGVPNFAKVTARGIYPGIDAVFYGSERRLEYDLIVAPGADPRQIRLVFDGGPGPRIAADGSLVLDSGNGVLRQLAPVVYQDDAHGRRHSVPGRYVLRGPDVVGFEVAEYDHDRALVLDPVLVYSSYLGGSGGDFAASIAVDAAGNTYIAGGTHSFDFPVAGNPRQPVLHNGESAFVSKLNASGSALVYSTYLGGSGNGDWARAIAIDKAGNAYVTGTALSHDFPVAGTPVQASIADGGGCICGDAFVTKLNATGSALVYSTFLGGSNPDYATGIALDAAGDAFVVGVTASPDFRVAGTPLQATFHGPAFTGNGVIQGDGFVAKLNPAGSALLYSTYLGGSGADFPTGVAVNAAGNAFVTGDTTSFNFPIAGTPFQSVSHGGTTSDEFGDAFVSKVNPTGSALVYSTYLGGHGDEASEAIAVDTAGNAYVAGFTRSVDFPVSATPLQKNFAGGGSFGDDAFLTKLNAGGSALVYSTYLGGAGDESAYGIAVDALGDAFVTGHTNSSNFPQVTPVQAGYGGSGPGFDPSGDAFVAKVNPGGSALLFSTYLGGSGDDSGQAIAIDGGGNAYVAGDTLSLNFPTAGVPFQKTYHGGSAYDGDAFVAKLSTAPAVTVAPPTNLTASANPGRKVTLHWKDNANNEDSYRIELKTGTAVFKEVAFVPANRNTTVLSGLVARARYSFRVRARKGSVNSTYSNSVAVTTLP